MKFIVGHLSGRVARHADQVNDGDIEPTQAGLVGRQCVDSAAGMLQNDNVPLVGGTLIKGQ